MLSVGLFFFYSFFLLSALVHSSPLLEQNGTVVSDLSTDGEDAHCIPVQRVRWVIDDISPVARWANLRGPLHSSITVSPPHHLSFFSPSFLLSYTSWLYFHRSKVQRVRPPPSAPVLKSPIEICFIAMWMRMTCQMTDSERVSKEYGSYLKPDSLTALLVSGFHNL